MNIFFSASIRAGRELQPQYEQIVAKLKEYGEVSGDHIVQDSLPRHGETELAEHEICVRELSVLEASDIVVAEVTVPSLGVGYLIGHAVALHKRVVCLYHGDDAYRLSAMIRGNKNIEVYEYHATGELHSILEKIFVQ